MSKFIPIGLFIVLVGFLYVGLDLDPKKLPSPLIGKKFPEVVINDFATGQEFKSTEYLKVKFPWLMFGRHGVLPAGLNRQ